MQTIGELLERNERFYPNKEAVVFESRRHTYRSLLGRVRRLADGLHKLGMIRQDRCAILAMNCMEYMELLGAGDWAGYIVTTLNFRLAEPEIQWILGDVKPKVLVFEAQYADAVERLRAKLPDIEHFVCIGGTPPAWARGFEVVVDSGTPEGPPFRSLPDDFGAMVYTSGTTGRPKGALRSQWRWVATAEGGSYASEFSSRTRVLLATPAFHVGVIGYAVQAYWYAGCVVLQRSFEPAAVLKAIETERITFTFVVAAMLQALLDAPGVDDADLSSLTNIVTAAAPVPVPLLQRAIRRLGPIFSVQYGATETGATMMFAHEVRPDGDERDVKRIASVGHPGPRTRIRVVDEAGRECPRGVPGEVLTFTDQRFDGYWNNTAATVEALRDGWCHTGDVGYLDEDDYLFLVDRKKDMIISGGENIYSREVESAVLAHPSVVDCAAIGIPDEKWGEVVSVVVVCRVDAVVTEAELIAHCKTLIASYKCPKRVTLVDALPRTGTGKINKVALREATRAAV
ncbi:AMP-binding protein [Ideonella sp. B508-1]|uniref:AMP-binding protein n=1 Tax=Ideonella sp. B508-1 TaxID=137716 RepID=UPI00034CD2A4|nr:AMP-binding protein [Ideonella sp. B508-1]